MRKILISVTSVLCVILLSFALVACGDRGNTPEPEKETKAIINGGFESADLSGWTVEYGDAFDNDCVSSRRTAGNGNAMADQHAQRQNDLFQNASAAGIDHAA